MEFKRGSNATRNIFYGGILKLLQTLIPFGVRTVFIYIMGVEYLGLNSLFTSILQVLNLAELGVGSALVYSMYKPIAEEDTDTICALMQLYKKYYRIIGAVILVGGLAVLPVLPMLVKQGLPADVNLYVLYLLNLASTVATYWLFAYKNCIIGAHQRSDVASKITLCVSLLTYTGQLLVLFLTRNYYLYIIVSIVTGILNNIVTAIVADKMYPNYKPRGKLPEGVVKGINSRIRDLFTSKLGAIIVYSADTLVISAFLGLRDLGIYQNYFYIVTTLNAFIEIIYSACLAGIGNSIAVESKEKNYHDLEKITLIVSGIMCFCTTCLMSLFQPFMKVWVGEELMLDSVFVMIMCINFVVYQLTKMLCTYKDASGMWHSDRFRPLCSALTNLGLNILMVKLGLGLHGIVLSTVIATGLIGLPWLIHNLFREVFPQENCRPYVLHFLGYIGVMALCAAAAYAICSLLALPTVLTLLVNLVICGVVSVCGFLLVYGRTAAFRDTVIMLNGILKGKLGFIVKRLPNAEKKKSK